MKISQSTISEINDKLGDIISSYVLLGTGRQKVARCPLPTHRERTPSFSYSKWRNMWKCFGCNEGGDAIKFLKLMHPEKTFTQIIETAAYILDLQIQYGTDGTYTPAPKVIKPTSFEVLELAILTEKVNATKGRQLSSNPLLANLAEIFGDDIVRTVIERYAVSFYGEWIEFPQIDIQNRYRTGKDIKYLRNGHRCKETTPQWAHTGITDNYKQCITGEHLLNYFPEKQIAIVEGPSTMLFMSCLSLYAEKNTIVQLQIFTKYIWLCTGAAGGVNLADKDIISVLSGKLVTLYPDTGAYTAWVKYAHQMKQNGIQSAVSLLMENAYKAGKVARNTDLRDYFSQNIEGIKELVNTQYKPYEHPEAPLSLNDMLHVNSVVYTGAAYGNILMAWIKTTKGDYDILFTEDGEVITGKQNDINIKKIEQFYEKRFSNIRVDNIPAYAMHIKNNTKN
ncbi:MAG: DUF6371 domain-containing protein [Chitinophagaceae bacterium]